jgi:polyribonucleotide nucleotidyltransferase
VWEEEVNNVVHAGAIDEGKRVDGRSAETIRPLFAQAGGVSEVLHGTGIFYRGGTHVLSVLTLGGPDDIQVTDGMEEMLEKRFMHHYNFPPFSTGEAGRMGVNRRMIGHGALVEKALSYVLPSEETFPYVIRIVSEVFASNGSSSMASTCASTLALMDAGVPIKAPVAGIAMGLMSRSDGAYRVLTDIQGPEDHYGDIDFKVAGTRTGITAVQMDVKVEGVSIQVLAEAFAAAKVARSQILSVIEAALPGPRPELAKSAPRILSLNIDPDKIGLVIGSGGKTIKKITEETRAEITINDSGRILITGKNGDSDKARTAIEALVHEFTPGERVEGVVTKLFEFGALVKIGPNAEGLVHISEIAPFHIEKVADILKEGMTVPVVVKEVDKQRGRIALSIKDADPDFVKQEK